MVVAVRADGERAPASGLLYIVTRDFTIVWFNKQTRVTARHAYARLR